MAGLEDPEASAVIAQVNIPRHWGEIRVDIRHAHAKQFLAAVAERARGCAIHIMEAAVLADEVSLLLDAVHGEFQERALAPSLLGIQSAGRGGRTVLGVAVEAAHSRTGFL